MPLINLGNFKNEFLSGKFLGTPRIEPGAAGLEAQTPSLCYAEPNRIVVVRLEPYQIVVFRGSSLFVVEPYRVFKLDAILFKAFHSYRCLVCNLLALSLGKLFFKIGNLLQK